MDTHDNTELATWPLIDRRKPDAAYEEMHATLEKISERLERIERKCDEMATAFVRDDLGGPELDTVGLAGALTNKPVFFIDQVLARKHSPERPGDVLLDLSVSGYAPVGPEGVEPAGSPGG